MLSYEQEEQVISKLVAAIIKVALIDLYGGNKKRRVEARNFFEKSKLFELTKLDYTALKAEYKRIHNISDEEERKLEEEDKLYVSKQENSQSNSERIKSTKRTSKNAKHARRKLRSGSKQRKRSSK